MLLSNNDALKAIKLNKMNLLFRNPHTLSINHIQSTKAVHDIASKQYELGLSATGLADLNTIREVEKVYGKCFFDPQTESSLDLFTLTQPVWVRRWGYFHLHEPHFTSWPIKCDSFYHYTKQNNWLSAMIRFVSGYSKNKQGTVTFDRPINSVITLDTISIGFDHTWAGTLDSRLTRMIKLDKELGVGVDYDICLSKYCIKFNVNSLDDLLKLSKEIPNERGKKPVVFGSPQWKFALIWHEISELESVRTLYAQCWVDTYAKEALRLVRNSKWSDEGLTTALVTRMLNSAQANFSRFVPIAKSQSKKKDGLSIMSHIYTSTTLYNKPERLQYVLKDPDFKLPVELNVISELSNK